MEQQLRRIARDDRLHLDDVTAERILTGSVTSDDVAPAYRTVTVALGVLRAPASDAELTGEAGTVASMTATLSGTERVGHRRAPVRSRRRIVYVASAAMVGSLSLFTGLAAANALPGAAQSVASDVLSHLGVSVHDPNQHAGDHPDTRGNGAGLPGVPTTPTTGNGKGGDISQLAHTTPATGVDKGAAISTEASGGQSQAGQHGASATAPSAAPDSHAPVSTPNAGGTGTADTASGGRSLQGTTNAATHSDGHSSAGSSNATNHKP